MGTSSSTTTDVGPTEDVVKALLEYLVDPMLPLKSTAREAPSISQQQSVARQVHAAVLLYNYYHVKHHPELEFLDFERFCKLAVILRPSLIMHMKFTHRSDHSGSSELEGQLSLTEKAIMDACTLARTLLAASVDVSSFLKWPITKVAVLVVDSTKENCLLLSNSVTQGVCSVIEKDLDFEDIAVGSKRKRINKDKPSLMLEQDAYDEAGFQQHAFSAVKEVTGISGAELKVLESHSAYSLSKEKTGARFYIMQCNQSISEDLQVPIKDAISSLQGPVVRRISGSWLTTPVVEYFHVLPYAGILSDWFSRGMLSNSLQDRLGLRNVDVNISQRSEPFEKELVESKDFCSSTLHYILKMESKSVPINSSKIAIPVDNEGSESKLRSDKKCSTSQSTSEEVQGVSFSRCTESPRDKDVIGTRTSSNKEASANSEFPMQKYNNGSHKNCLPDTSCEHHNMDIGDSCLLCPQKENENRSTRTILKVYHHQRKRTSTNGIKFKADAAELKTTPSSSECEEEKLDTEKKSCTISHDPDATPAVDHSLVPFEQSTNYREKMEIVMAAKGSELSQTALRVLIRKREKLSNEQRNLEDEIAVCDRKIQAIVDGAENDLALKLEALIDCCNEVCLQDNMHVQSSPNHHLDDPGLPQYVNGKRLSEAIFTMLTPCQELDDICRANNWTLPIYRVLPSNGGFVANVTMKGVDFDFSDGSELHHSPREARDAAALKMIARLRTMASQSL